LSYHPKHRTNPIPAREPLPYGCRITAVSLPAHLRSPPQPGIRRELIHRHPRPEPRHGACSGQAWPVPPQPSSWCAWPSWQAAPRTPHPQPEPRPSWTSWS